MKNRFPPRLPASFPKQDSGRYPQWMLLVTASHNEEPLPGNPRTLIERKLSRVAHKDSSQVKRGPRAQPYTGEVRRKHPFAPGATC